MYLLTRFFSSLFLGLVRFYQLALSPWLGRSCRFTPTCSAYMAESIRKWGPWKGLGMGLRRIGRCRPGGGSGWDPVPEKTAP